MYPHYSSDTAPITPSSANNGKNNYLPPSYFSALESQKLLILSFRGKVYGTNLFDSVVIVQI